MWVTVTLSTQELEIVTIFGSECLKPALPKMVTISDSCMGSLFSDLVYD